MTRDREARKCSCGENSPDRLVVHRIDGPCYLRDSRPGIKDEKTMNETRKKNIQAIEKKTFYCEWSFDDISCHYDTDCDNAHVFIEDGIAENKYKFCPYCGKKIIERKP